MPGEKVGSFKTCLMCVLEEKKGRGLGFVSNRVSHLAVSCFVKDMAGLAGTELPPTLGSLPLSTAALAEYLHPLNSGTSIDFTADTTPLHLIYSHWFHICLKTFKPLSSCKWATAKTINIIWTQSRSSSSFPWRHVTSHMKFLSLMMKSLHPSINDLFKAWYVERGNLAIEWKVVHIDNFDF